MATIITLSGPDGPLSRITVPLPSGVQPERCFYGCGEFIETFTKELPKWTTGRLKSAQTPPEQMDDILEKWTGGKNIRYGKMFQDLIPGSDEVWELKTADLRIFGWIYRPKVFIAARLGYADFYKPPNPKLSYEDARKFVMDVRKNLDIDPPKFTGGLYDALI